MTLHGELRTMTDFVRFQRGFYCFFLTCLLVFGCFPVAALAENGLKPEQLLMAMAKAMQEQNYSGTFVYIRPGRIETMRIAHASKPDGVYERLITLNGARREVVRTPSGTSCYLPDRRRVVVNNRPAVEGLLSGFPKDVESLKDYYHFELGRSERIADLDTFKLAMLPKDAHRYGRLFWIDQASYLPLKYELVNDHGDMIERMIFTSLLIAEPSDQDLNAMTDATGFTRIEHPPMKGEQPELDSGWSVSGLPAGFRLRTHEKRQFGGNEDVEHMVYSDGVASISIFISNHNPSDTVAPKGAHVGGVNVYKSMQGDKQITVMGEVPQSTVQMIGHNLSLSGAHD